MRHSLVRYALVGALVVAGLTFATVETEAQSWVFGAGNGGSGDCGASGGAAGLGNINSGGNAGSDIGIGDSIGEVDVYGGDWSWATRVRANLNGGTAICSGPGGSFPF